MRPDPGRELLEARMAELTPDERTVISMELKARGFALVWDQLDRQFAERFAAGTWSGPVRPEPLASTAADRQG